MPNPLPSASSYASVDAAAAAHIAQANANWSGLLSGSIQGGNFDDFRAASALGFVPLTPEGYATFLFYWTRTPMALFADGLAEFAGFQFAYQTANGIGAGGANYGVDYVPTLATQKTTAFLANGVASSQVNEFLQAVNRYLPDAAQLYGLTVPGGIIQDTAELIQNPVTGAMHLRADVVFQGPDPKTPGYLLFRLKDGSEWSYPGPDYVAPPAPRVREKVEATYILGDDQGDGIRPVVAVRYHTSYTDGSSQDSAWSPFAAYGTVEGFRAGYTGSAAIGTNPTVPARAVLFYRDLDPTTLAQIAADTNNLAGVPATTIPGSMDGPGIPIPPGPGDLLPPEPTGPARPPLDGGSPATPGPLPSSPGGSSSPPGSGVAPPAPSSPPALDSGAPGAAAGRWMLILAAALAALGAVYFVARKGGS